MARFKLPEPLKAWKVASSLPEKNGYPQYAITRKEADGSVTQAVLTHIAFNDDKYNSDNVQFVNEEAAFIKNVMRCGVSNYIAAEIMDRPPKQRIALFIITERLSTLSEKLSEKSFSEDEIIDFGLQMSDLLAKLEKNNIFHGNLNPDNICVTDDGHYKLSGFTDFESSIKDLSFIAPEIANDKTPDYTTDLYSLGLMMYAMSSGGSIPFEGENVTREKAIEKRFAGESITAPKNGSEKLKSVIVIACQPDNRNRWKNAGNLKNALASINSDAEPQKQEKEEIIAPKGTDFNGNVFEESAFTEEKPSETPDDQAGNNDKAAKAAAAAIAGGAAAVAAGAAKNKNQQADKNLDKIKDAIQQKNGKSAEGKTLPESDAATVQVPISDIKAAKQSEDKSSAKTDKPAQGNEIDNRVFDDYQLQTKVFSLKDAAKDNKDYGEFFEDEPEVEAAPDTEEKVDTEFGQNGFYEDNSFYAEQKEEEKRNRKGIIALIISVVAVIALASVFCVIAFSNDWFSDKGKPAEQVATVQPFTEDTTAPPVTTAPATTVAPTTQPSEEVYPPNVLGAYYDYAKSVLEEEGFKVVRGEDAESQYYEEGLVMSMEPTSEDLVKPGSTITLYVSSGLIDDSDNGEDEYIEDDYDEYDDEYDGEYDYEYEDEDENAEDEDNGDEENNDNDNNDRPSRRN